MATAATIKTDPQLLTAHRYDRAFYSMMAIAMALAVLVGFAPTYYLKVFGHAPMVTVSRSPFTTLVHLHAAVFTSWVLLFIVQTALVANHRVAVHRRLGIAGALLAAVMVCLGVSTAIQAAGRGVAPPGINPTAFLAIPLGDISLFSIFIAAAWWLRRNKEAHKRLMLLGYISILVAAVARWPHVLPFGPLAFYGLTFVFLLAGVLYDLKSRHRVHPAYLWGGALFVVSVPLRLMISTTGAWRKFAEFLVGMRG